MARLCNALFSLLNSFAMLVGLIYIALSMYVKVHGATECQALLLNTELMIGIILFIFGLLGLIGACCRANALLLLYLIVLTIWIVGLVVFVSALHFASHRMGEHPDWLQNRFLTREKWNGVKRCLIEEQFCKQIRINVTAVTDKQFRQQAPYPVEKGCCMPPIECGYEFKNATFWSVDPQKELGKQNYDCAAWKNEEKGLCYDCDSCRIGFLATFKRNGVKLAAVSAMGMLLVMTLFWCTGCLARVNIEEKQKKYSPYP